jgi:hypothetical protein
MFNRDECVGRFESVGRIGAGGRRLVFFDTLTVTVHVSIPTATLIMSSNDLLPS